jgi:hypothetical protein
VDLAYYLIGDRQVMALTTSDHYKFGNTIPAVRMIERVDGRVGSVGDYPEERRIHAVAVRGDCLERYHYRVGISGELCLRAQRDAAEEFAFSSALREQPRPLKPQSDQPLEPRVLPR